MAAARSLTTMPVWCCSHSIGGLGLVVIVGILRAVRLTNNKEYASGVWFDTNGRMVLIVVARAESWAILWRSAILATLATLDDRVCRLDPSGGVCRDQSHRPGASSGLGTRDHPRHPLRRRRLVSLCTPDAGRICGFKTLAADASAPRSRRADSSDLLGVVLRRLGHRWTGPSLGPRVDLCARVGDRW